MKKDKYDEAIAYLTEHPEGIEHAWASPYARHLYGGLLFKHTGAGICGCLTQVRNGEVAPTPELTAEIRADERIPKSPCDITVESLPVFAEWQRKLDAWRAAQYDEAIAYLTELTDAWHAAQDGGEG